MRLTEDYAIGISPPDQFTGRGFEPVMDTPDYPSPGEYQPAQVLSPQFQNEQVNINFRRFQSLGGKTRMTITKRGVAFSVETGSGQRMSRTAGGGRRFSQRLPQGYYYRKAQQD